MSYGYIVFLFGESGLESGIEIGNFAENLRGMGFGNVHFLCVEMRNGGNDDAVGGDIFEYEITLVVFRVAMETDVDGYETVFDLPGILAESLRCIFCLECVDCRVDFFFGKILD